MVTIRDFDPSVTGPSEPACDRGSSARSRPIGGGYAADRRRVGAVVACFADGSGRDPTDDFGDPSSVIALLREPPFSFPY